MRIGLVLSSSPGYSETFFRSKISGLMQSGHSVVLFCRDDSTKFELCPVQMFPRKRSNSLLRLLSMFRVYFSLIPHISKVFRFIQMEREIGRSWGRILKSIYFNAPVFKESLDWLHFGFGTMALGRECLAGSVHAGMAVSFRGFDIGVYPIKHPGCYDLLWKKADKIHVISDDIKNLLYTEGFKDEAPVIKITPAIDTDFFQVDRFNKVEEPLSILTVARLHWKKGLDYTLKALAGLKKNGIQFKYTIIGTGPEYENLKYACYQLDLEKEVKFAGKLTHETIREMMTGSMLYLQFSVQEGFCNAVLEAQAMGLLCIVSDAEGLSENVLHESTGWVVPKRDSEKLTSMILDVLKLPVESQKSISYAARERVRKSFNIQQQAEAFLRFYE